MKPIFSTRSLRPWSAMLLVAAALVCVHGVQAQGNRQPVNQPSGPPPGMYAQGRTQPTAPHPASGVYPGGRPSNYPQPNRSYAGPQAGSQRGLTQPQANGFAQPQANGYGQRGYGAPASGYGQGRGFAQAQNAPAPQDSPNHNANYTGMNQQPPRQNPAQRFWQQQPDGMGANATRGEHLQQWMQHHNNLTTQDQQRALQREPGFNQLPQPTQQRMLDRLQRLNSMPPEQRNRTLQRSEQMERLSPVQRSQVRSAMGDLGALPEDRRRAVARSFRDLRSLPPEQRNQILQSPAFHQQFSDQERGTLNNLLTVSPMLPQQ